MERSAGRCGRFAHERATHRRAPPGGRLRPRRTTQAASSRTGSCSAVAPRRRASRETRTTVWPCSCGRAVFASADRALARGACGQGEASWLLARPLSPQPFPGSPGLLAPGVAAATHDQSRLQAGSRLCSTFKTRGRDAEVNNSHTHLRDTTASHVSYRIQSSHLTCTKQCNKTSNMMSDQSMGRAHATQHNATAGAGARQSPRVRPTRGAGSMSRAPNRPRELRQPLRGPSLPRGEAGSGRSTSAEARSATRSGRAERQGAECRSRCRLERRPIRGARVWRSGGSAHASLGPRPPRSSFRRTRQELDRGGEGFQTQR